MLATAHPSSFVSTMLVANTSEEQESATQGKSLESAVILALSEVGVLSYSASP